jgi:uncharacterized membrane protein
MASKPKAHTSTSASTKTTVRIETKARSENSRTPADAAASPRPRVLSRSTVLPAAGIGLVTALLAAQEHAPAVGAVVAGVAVAFVVIGMIALKRVYRGE